MTRDCLEGPTSSEEYHWATGFLWLYIAMILLNCFFVATIYMEGSLIQV